MNWLAVSAFLLAKYFTYFFLQEFNITTEDMTDLPWTLIFEDNITTNLVQFSYHTFLFFIFLKHISYLQECKCNVNVQIENNYTKVISIICNGLSIYCTYTKRYRIDSIFLLPVFHLLFYIEGWKSQKKNEQYWFRVN